MEAPAPGAVPFLALPAGEGAKERVEAGLDVTLLPPRGRACCFLRRGGSAKKEPADPVAAAAAGRVETAAGG